jgi:hypothetical protein
VPWNFGEAVEKLDYFRSQAARRNDLINVSDVGAEAAQIPFAFRSILA